MTSVLVCIPTLSGREPYLVNAIRGFAERTAANWNISLVRDAPSAGEGWNACADRLIYYPETTHLFFFNDDAVVGTDWLPPLIEATDAGCVPAPRIEPAGGHIDEFLYETHPPMPPSTRVAPDKAGYFYADLPENQPKNDWDEVPHGNMPFCSIKQWNAIGRFPPFHYGTDVFFYTRARELGYRVVARHDSVVFNYNAQAGRSKGEWSEQDFLDFDGVIALPAYLSGELAPDKTHPLRLTPEGLDITRSWRRRHLESGG